MHYWPFRYDDWCRRVNFVPISQTYCRSRILSNRAGSKRDYCTSLNTSPNDLYLFQIPPRRLLGYLNVPNGGTGGLPLISKEADRRHIPVHILPRNSKSHPPLQVRGYSRERNSTNQTSKDALPSITHCLTRCDYRFGCWCMRWGRNCGGMYPDHIRTTFGPLFSLPKSSIKTTKHGINTEAFALGLSTGTVGRIERR